MANILLIDDDDDLRQFLEDNLKLCGHQVWCLGRAEGGLDVLAAGQFDLVVADVKMPGMSGPELLRALRKRGVDIAFILMTGLASSPIVEEVENLNAIVVSKPMGGRDQFWKELAPKLDQALKGEAEIRACLGRAFDAAFKRRQTGLAPYLQEVLDGVLLVNALNQTRGNQKEAEKVLGVRMKDLDPQKRKSTASPQARHQKFVMDALILIADHPDWTVAAYAEELDCSKAKLWNDPIINDALKRRKGERKLRSGFRDADGDVDASDECT
jgi:DNA-binding NtrC family response regulator